MSKKYIIHNKLLFFYLFNKFVIEGILIIVYLGIYPATHTQ